VSCWPAWLSVWSRHGTDFPKILSKHYSDNAMSLPYYWERIACYQCYMALDAMRFFAKMRDRGAYESTCQALRTLLAT
jgi:hypothetical protein